MRRYLPQATNRRFGRGKGSGQKALRLAFLVPDLQRDTLAGHQSASLNLERLWQIEIPLCRRQQRQTLG